MKSLQPHQRLLLYLFLALILACVISPILSLGADWFMAQWPAWMPKRIPFHRIFNRAFMISGILLFIIFRRALLTSQLEDLFRTGPAPASRFFFTGLGLAVGTVILMVAAMSAADVATPLARPAIVKHLTSAALTGFFTGLFEEVFFRGILFMGLLSHGRRLRAYLLANLFYVVIHFIRPSKAYYLDGLDLGAGFLHLAHTVTPFLAPLYLLPGMIGLLLVGSVLSLALERTGKLYLGIGLHAGWIFGLKSLPLFGNFQRDRLGWIFGAGEPKFISGPATWIAILLTGAAVHYLTRNRAVQSTDPPHAVTA